MPIILDKFDEFVKTFDLKVRDTTKESMHFSNKLVVNRDEDKCVLTYHVIKMLLESNTKLQETIAEQQRQIKTLSDHGAMLEQRLDQFWDMTHLRIDSLLENDNM